MTDVWDLYAELTEKDLSSLTLPQRRIVALCDLRQEVNADGFDAYFRYWGGNSAQEALEALPTLLGDDWADLLRAAMELLGSPYPVDPDDRATRIDARDLGETLQDLDERFYELEASTDADARLSDFIRANPELGDAP
jgi:hypothetical protein